MSSPHAYDRKAALTVAEFCTTCSIGRTSFYAAVGEGRIRILKFGARTLVPVSEIGAFLASLDDALDFARKPMQAQSAGR